MAGPNAISGLVLLGVSAFVAFEAIRLSLGSLRSPGPGLFPLLLSIVLAGLSAALCVRGVLDRRAGRPAARPASRGHARQVWATVLALVAYVVLLPRLGYLVVTFLLLGALFRIGGVRGWMRGGALAAAFTAGVGLLASVLGVPLPDAALWQALLERLAGA